MGHWLFVLAVVLALTTATLLTLRHGTRDLWDAIVALTLFIGLFAVLGDDVARVFGRIVPAGRNPGEWQALRLAVETAVAVNVVALAASAATTLLRRLPKTRPLPPTGGT